MGYSCIFPKVIIGNGDLTDSFSWWELHLENAAGGMRQLSNDYFDSVNSRIYYIIFEPIFDAVHEESISA
jgi:hypothetical protein